MINWLHLLWICPVCVLIGIFISALATAAGDRDKNLEN